MLTAIKSTSAIVYVVLLMLTPVVYWVMVNDMLAQQACLVLLSALLLGYLCFEIKQVSTHQKELLLLNPAVLASILTFVLGFGLSNILYILPKDLVAAVDLPPEVTEWMNFLMMLVL